MAMNVFRDDWGHMPPERYFCRFFNEAMHNLEYPFAMRPYWLDQPMMEHCNIGNAVGKVSSSFSNIFLCKTSGENRDD